MISLKQIYERFNENLKGFKMSFWRFERKFDRNELFREMVLKTDAFIRLKLKGDK